MIITFPGAVHMGFSVGLNLSEAANFAPLEWLEAGRECVDWYRFNRAALMSHERLCLTLAKAVDCLDVDTCTLLSVELDIIIGFESHFRARATKAVEMRQDESRLNLNTSISQPTLDEDEGYKCYKCLAYCIMSNVQCKCCPNGGRMCLHCTHGHKCKPAERVVSERISLQQLEGLKAEVERRGRELRQGEATPAQGGAEAVG
jgi:hypothetical protein